eukprot:CAMPEP_0183324538 /NCGR_PEP_ID=MMETSP0160_2-20130417/77276_1 /TAXON_ID=2839 ORGANISM="Odontella Sinensis, Strain Grunow 1884" /NCGR_SAMPLE_ID=MMETSP0160_2 /ASSEMBLY_ACC=CAM_ASM_000250 /LENGTH=65 /DNA_ID=CAMNT_0025492135 /DNA_START=68 /DNA_END=265 /DNA_ORIENTATION=+
MRNSPTAAHTSELFACPVCSAPLLPLAPPPTAVTVRPDLLAHHALSSDQLSLVLNVEESRTSSEV